MITERQEQLLNFLIREYISTAEPVSSHALKESSALDVCGATIRNDLQSLTKEGYIEQPHISAGRIPTKKAYRHIATRITQQRENSLSEFIIKEIQTAREQIQEEMRLAEELIKSLSETSITLSIETMPEEDDLFEILSIIGSSRPAYRKNITIISKIIKDYDR